jgi:hypothetical protein
MTHLQTDTGITQHVPVPVSIVWKIPSLVVGGKQVELTVVDAAIGVD